MWSQSISGVGIGIVTALYQVLGAGRRIESVDPAAFGEYLATIEVRYI